MYEMKIVFCNMKNIRNRMRIGKKDVDERVKKKISKVVMDTIYLKCTH